MIMLMSYVQTYEAQKSNNALTPNEDFSIGK